MPLLTLEALLAYEEQEASFMFSVSFLLPPGFACLVADKVDDGAKGSG